MSAHRDLLHGKTQKICCIYVRFRNLNHDFNQEFLAHSVSEMVLEEEEHPTTPTKTIPIPYNPVYSCVSVRLFLSSLGSLLVCNQYWSVYWFLVCLSIRLFICLSVCQSPGTCLFP